MCGILMDLFGYLNAYLQPTVVFVICNFHKGFFAQVNFQPMAKWAAVVYLYGNRFAICKIGNPYAGTERQLLMGSCIFAVAEFLATRRFAAVKLIRVIRRTGL